MTPSLGQKLSNLNLACRAAEQECAAIQVRCRCNHEEEGGEDGFPGNVAEKLVDTYECGNLVLVTPTESMVLAFYLSKSSRVDRRPKPTHDAVVEVKVVFVLCLIDCVEIAVHEPRLAGGWRTAY